MVDGHEALDPAAIELALRRSGADLAPGLTDAEVDRLRDRFGIEPAPDHRLMLSIALPLGDDGRWPDWRKGDSDDLQKRVDWPADGILFDVEHNAFWHPSWPVRPTELADARSVAMKALSDVPRLAPLYSHRYVPTQPAVAGNPVLSCYQTDIIYYGKNLLDWFNREFHQSGTRVPPEPERRLPFWSWFLEDDE
jgi:hypothetical protein